MCVIHSEFGLGHCNDAEPCDLTDNFGGSQRNTPGNFLSLSLICALVQSKLGSTLCSLDCVLPVLCRSAFKHAIIFYYIHVHIVQVVIEYKNMFSMAMSALVWSTETSPIHSALYSRISHDG